VPAAVVSGHRRPASRGEALELEQASHVTKMNVKRVVVTQVVHGKVVKVSHIVRVSTVPVVPPHPEPERLREIQKALAAKGYFKGEPTGEWNADSISALKQFQTDSNLTPDGKINALSLIGLGLGPKHLASAAVPPMPAEKPQPSIQQ
jgi:hypothetical protein